MIAIIGGGFCGTMAAVHLLGSSLDASTTIVLINRGHTDTESPALARGLAYGTNSPHHLLNVPAARMSAFENKPNDFLRHLHAQRIAANAHSFVARHHYGAYLASILSDAAAQTKATFRVQQATVITIRTAADQHRISYTLGFASGETLTADSIILALGNFLPANPAFVDATLASSKHYIRDPWQHGALDRVDVKEPILLIGTGLTMCDVVTSLKLRAVEANVPLQIHALSRRGLWPKSHRPHLSAAPHDMAPTDIAKNPTARGYLRAVRAQVKKIVAQGGDWRDVVASLRPITPMLWHLLPLLEKKRFIRHLKPYWESHRHRAAPEILKLVIGCVERGEISSNASRILGFQIRNNDATLINVTHQPRGKTVPETISVATIINCTGPSTDIAAEPLLANLAATGFIRQDALQLGIEVDTNYRAINADGNIEHAIYYVGPLLKANHWEATAVPELRLHVAACVAACMAACIAEADNRNY